MGEGTQPPPLHQRTSAPGDRDADVGEGAWAEPRVSGLAADQGAGPIKSHAFFLIELKIDW